MRKNDFTDSELFRQGELKKPLHEMNKKEREQLYKEMPAKIRKYLFSIGQPLVYENEDGDFVAEHSDGRIEILDRTKWQQYTS